MKHTVKLREDEVTDERTGFLKQAFADVPESMIMLKEEVEK